MASRRRNSDMDRAEIERKVLEFDEDPGWYQNIDLGMGLRTKSRVIYGEDPDHPKQRWDCIASAVPDALSGKSVLDLGCNAGYFAFEAARRGATDVHGIDLRRGYVDQARFCAEVTGLPVTFDTTSVYDLKSLERTYDLVFFVGLLYHCKYILEAVDQVSAVAADTVIVESAIELDTGDEPLVSYVGNNPNRPGTWQPSIPAMIEMFKESGFESVEPLFQRGGRGGIVARRNG